MCVGDCKGIGGVVSLVGICLGAEKPDAVEERGAMGGKGEGGVIGEVGEEAELKEMGAERDSGLVLLEGVTSRDWRGWGSEFELGARGTSDGGV